MTLTQPFEDIITERHACNADVRTALLAEAIALPLTGEIDSGKRMLNSFIRGTVGFPALAAALSLPEKSVVRTLATDSNPRAETLFSMIDQLQVMTGVTLSVHSAA